MEEREIKMIMLYNWGYNNLGFKCSNCKQKIVGFKKRCDSCHLFKVLDKKLARKCNSAVSQAIKKGKMVRKDTCEHCGSNYLINARHPDYSDPYRVRWLCKDCHVGEHQALGSYIWQT